MRTYPLKGIDHHVYELPEEIPKDLVYLKNWRDAEIGDWVLADDGCIIQILRRSLIQPKYGKAVRFFGTCTGTFSEKSKMDTFKRKNIYNLSGKRYSDSRKKSLSKKEVLFTQNISRGVSPTDAYLKVFRTNNRKYAEHRSGILVNTRRVRRLMKKELQPVMKALGIDPEMVLAGIRDIALDSNAKHSDKLKALFELGEILELKDVQKTTEVTGALFQGFQPQQIEKAERPQLEEVKNA